MVFDKICIHGFLSYKTIEQLLLNHERVPIIVAAHLLPLIPLDGNHMRGVRDVGAMQGNAYNGPAQYYQDKFHSKQVKTETF